MASVAPSTKGVSSIKSLILNPALTSHYQVTIAPPFNDDGFSSFWEMLVLHIILIKKS